LILEIWGWEIGNWLKIHSQLQVEKLIKELPSVPSDWSNGDVNLSEKNPSSNGVSVQQVENGTSVRETQSMLLERIASEMNRLKFYVTHAKVCLIFFFFPFLLNTWMLCLCVTVSWYLCWQFLDQIYKLVGINILVENWVEIVCWSLVRGEGYIPFCSLRVRCFSGYYYSHTHHWLISILKVKKIKESERDKTDKKIAMFR